MKNHVGQNIKDETQIICIIRDGLEMEVLVTGGIENGKIKIQSTILMETNEAIELTSEEMGVAKDSLYDYLDSVGLLSR